MSLNKQIYKISKKFFDTKRTTAFTSTGQSKDINTEQNLFAINCVRYLLNDELAFIDPTEKEADFKNFVKFLRLNDFQASGKGLDTGTGFEVANNLIYRLAIKFLKTKNENLEEIGSKITLVNKAFSYPDFEGEFLLNVFLDEPETYQCITKQAFYKWHYSTYVENTPLSDKIPAQNFLDLSSLGWTKVPVPLLTSREENNPVNSIFYISQNGSPYNTGFPVLCAVFEVGGIKGIDEFLNSKRFNEIEKKLEEQISNTFNRQKDNLNTLTRVEKITHKTNLTNKDIVYEASTTKAGKPLLRFCLAYDYQRLVLLQQKAGTKQSFYGKIKTALAEKKNAVVSFKSTTNLDTIAVINSQVERLSNSLTLRDAAVQQGPALFFDLTDPSINAVKDSFKKQDIDEQTTNALLSRQYSLNLSTLSLALTREYSFLTERYLKERQASSLFRNFDRDRISEDISFYYDEAYRLLAIVGENKTTEFNTKLVAPVQTQKNLIPFEFQEDQPISSIDFLFSLIPETIQDADAFSSISGINGEIAVITEDFVEMLSTQQEFDEEDLKGLSIVLANDHYEKTILKVPTDPLSVITTSINGFFYNSNEILLSDQRSPTAPPVISRELLKAPTNKIIDFFESNDTPDSIGFINNKDISKFLLRYHYPRLQISPSVEKTPAQQVLKEAIDQARNLIAISKGAIGEGIGDTNKVKRDNEKLLNKIKQIPGSSPFASKDKFKDEALRQVLIVAAASSKDPCLKDLTKILARDGLEGIYEHVLTKFDWDQLVAKALLNNLDTVNKIAQTAGDVKQLTEAVNRCLDSLGIESVLDSYVNLKDGLKNYKKYTEYTIKAVPGLVKKISYTFILDFQQQFRDRIARKARESAVKALDFILSTMLDELLDSFCELDDEFEKLILEKFNNGLNLDQLGGPVLAGKSIGTNSTNITKAVEPRFEVDIVEIINRSNLEPLDNVLNGATELFPILSIESKKLSDTTLIIRAYLDSLSENINPKQLKSLLDGTQNEDLVKLNKIVVEDLSIDKLVKNELSSSVALAILFDYLNEFIDRDILNVLILASINQTVDKCFIKIDVIDTEQKGILQDFLKTSSSGNESLNDKLNALTDYISELCATIDNLANLERVGSIETLLSDFDKNSLLSSIDTNIKSITATQNSSKQEVVNLSDDILIQVDEFISGNSKKSYQQLGQEIVNSPFLTDEQKSFLLQKAKQKKINIPEDIIPAIQNFLIPGSSQPSFGITFPETAADKQIGGVAPKKLELVKKGNSIIVFINDKEIINFNAKAINPEALIGNLIDIVPTTAGSNFVGILAYYDLILNKAATNEEFKGKQGYVIQAYDPNDFKFISTDTSSTEPFTKNFFNYLNENIAKTTSTQIFETPKVDVKKIIDNIFEDQEVLANKYKQKLNTTISESTSAADFDISNLVKMKQIINKIKE